MQAFAAAGSNTKQQQSTATMCPQVLGSNCDSAAKPVTAYRYGTRLSGGLPRRNLAWGSSLRLQAQACPQVGTGIMTNSYLRFPLCFGHVWTDTCKGDANEAPRNPTAASVIPHVMASCTPFLPRVLTTYLPFLPRVPTTYRVEYRYACKGCMRQASC